MLQRIALTIALVISAIALHAEEPARLDDLLTVLRMDETLEIMSREGIDYGSELEAELFPDRGGAQWKAVVAEIYDGARLDALMRDALGGALSGTDLDPMIAFFQSDTGKRIITLEISARRALLDPGVEEASREALDRMKSDDDPRLDLIGEFIAVNDLVEMNVAGGLNANYAFYSGLNDGGAFPHELSESEMLAEVWGQEREVRQDTETWLSSYLAMAYEPLSDDALKSYIAFSATPEGQALNAALFEAYDAIFRAISRELGLAAAKFIRGQDI